MLVESQCNSPNFKHIPVMGNVILDSIKTLPPKFLNEGLIIDATVGGGGHSALILQSHPNLRTIGLDQDPNAITAATSRLKIFGNRAKLVNTNFADFTPSEKAVLIIADLGVSSPQIDEGSRGFSFQLDGPLDMRMKTLK